ncbi:nucleoside hydrolase-like domain-containing protein [Reichenbachiella versicolor]|uniref:nucleoside hydrolase-like domain-containing protein n=1 Tax=Reichenbachiella versicolor TaxID=1821036 RepID=UPI000D6DE2EF|nr:nucleoside hydrolase-like domain-containing protein [Reichenbachiella versicolor]
MYRVLLILLILSSYCLIGRHLDDKHRLIIMADMGNEPDEMQQMIHMITCSNEFDIEGLIAVTGKYLHPNTHLGDYNKVTHPELFHEIVDAYAKVYKNLLEHSSSYPNPESLRGKITSGQREYGIADVGKGKSSKGSELIIQAAKKNDTRPIWIVINAGSNTLAQALFDYRDTHSSDELSVFISKLRVFENGSQDNAGSWICSEFPDIHWIRSNFQTYSYGGPGWGNNSRKLGPYYWHPYEYSTKGQLDWQKKHIMVNHGPLGDLYPERRFHAWGDGVIGYMEGGGTIPWMGLINKGLFDIDQPSWGGWSGRFTAKKIKNYWSKHKDIKIDEEKVAPFYCYGEASDTWTDPLDDSTYLSNYVPIWRWREAMYNDQIARMDWCVKDYNDANHHPIAAVGEDKSNTTLRIKTKANKILNFDASLSSDPDNDNIQFKWWIYQEAGNYTKKLIIDNNNKPKCSLEIPEDAIGKQIHLILEIKDDNEIVNLFDYRRIVIDVK